MFDLSGFSHQAHPNFRQSRSELRHPRRRLLLQSGS
jgi:hypothetical protein